MLDVLLMKFTIGIWEPEKRSKWSDSVLLFLSYPQVFNHSYLVHVLLNELVRNHLVKSSRLVILSKFAILNQVVYELLLDTLIVHV